MKKGAAPVGIADCRTTACALRTDQLAERHLYVVPSTASFQKPAISETLRRYLCISHCPEITFQFDRAKNLSARRATRMLLRQLISIYGSAHKKNLLPHRRRRSAHPGIKSGNPLLMLPRFCLECRAIFGSSSLIPSRFPGSQILVCLSFSRFIGYAMDFEARSLYTVTGSLRHLT